MHGHVVRIVAKPGKREALLAILLENTGTMAGCISYVIATDQGDADAIWVTEVWESKAAHTASLSLPNVQAAIAQAMPHIASLNPRSETTPVGGIGLPSDGRLP
jgi:quinol monooxygenase YgiN